MAYCIICGKETENGQNYCAEHAVQHPPQNMNLFTQDVQQPVNNNYPPVNNNYPPVNNNYPPVNNNYPPVNNNYAPVNNNFTPVNNNFAPVNNNNNFQKPVSPFVETLKKAPLWIFAVFALGAAIVTAILSVIGSAILNLIVDNVYFIDTDFLRYMTNGQIIPNIVFLVCAVASVIVYNKMCEKNGLKNATFPVYYCGLFYICRMVGALVASIITNVIMFIISIVSEVAGVYFYGYEAYSVVTTITSFISGIIFVLGTFGVFFFIYKKQTEEKTAEEATEETVSAEY